MYIKILRSTTASGVDLIAGTTAEVSDRDAGLLIGMGKAEICAEKPKAKKAKKDK